MAAEFPTSIPVFTGTSETAPATTTPSDFATWAQKVEDELLALAQKSGVGPGKGVTESFVSGIWNSPEGPTGNSGPAQDLLCLRRYEYPYGTTVTQLGVWVNVLGTAGASPRLGIYDDDGTGTYPGTLLVDGGLTTADISTTGFKSCTAFGAVNIGGRPIWAGAVLQGGAIGAGQFIGLTAGSRGMAIATVPNANVMTSYTNTGVTGALPGTFGATRAVTNGNHKIYVK